MLIFTTGGLDSPRETRDSHMGVPMYHATPGLPEILRIIETSAVSVGIWSMINFPRCMCF